MLAFHRLAWTPERPEQVYQQLLHAICDDELAPGVRTASALGAILSPSSPATCTRCPSAQQLMRRLHATYASTT